MLSINSIDESSYIYGPGKRFVIWVQGCSIRCEGCWNTQMWDASLGQHMTVENILDKILLQKDLEGITILGGEPLDQKEEILNLVRNVKKLDLTVVFYTGYELQEISSKISNEIISLSDISIIGRYIEKFRNTNLRLRGSSNQTLIINNKDYKNYFKEDFNEIEVTINSDGSMVITGYPDCIDELI